jgi:hypothetical protein
MDRYLVVAIWLSALLVKADRASYNLKSGPNMTHLSHNRQVPLHIHGLMRKLPVPQIGDLTSYRREVVNLKAPGLY